MLAFSPHAASRSRYKTATLLIEDPRLYFWGSEEALLLLSFHDTPVSPALATWPNRYYADRRDTAYLLEHADGQAIVPYSSGGVPTWRISASKVRTKDGRYLRVVVPVHLLKSANVRKAGYVRCKLVSPTPGDGKNAVTQIYPLRRLLRLPPLSALNPTQSAPLASQACGVLAGFALMIAAVLLERRGDTKSSASKKKDPYLYQAAIAVFILSFTACSLASCLYLLPGGGALGPEGAYLFHGLASVPFAIGAVLLFLGIYLALAASYQRIELISAYWAYILASMVALYFLLHQNTSAIAEVSWSGHAFVLSKAEWGCFATVVLGLGAYLLCGYYFFRFDALEGAGDITQRVRPKDIRLSKGLEPNYLNRVRTRGVIVFSGLAAVATIWNAWEQVKFAALDEPSLTHGAPASTYASYPMDFWSFAPHGLMVILLIASLWLLQFCWYPPFQAGGGFSTTMLHRVTVYLVVTLLALLLVSMCVAYFWYHNGDLASSDGSILARAMLCTYYVPSMIIGYGACALVPAPWLFVDNQLALDSFRVVSVPDQSGNFDCQWISSFSDAGDMFILLYANQSAISGAPMAPTELLDSTVEQTLSSYWMVGLIVVDNEGDGYDGGTMDASERLNGWMYESMEHSDARRIVQHFGRKEGAVLTLGPHLDACPTVHARRVTSSVLGDEFMEVRLGPVQEADKGKWRLLFYDQETHDFSLSRSRKLLT